MITGVLQIPNRIPVGSVLFGGTPIEKRFNDTVVKVLSGRSIRVVPLFFYKFFSQWGKSFYEHIFATDEPFDTVTLTRFVDSSTGDYSKSRIGSVLVPISMKRISNTGVQNFLFAKSINFLICNYQIGLPLAEIPFDGVSNFDSSKCIEIPVEGLFSKGVASYGAYRKFLFEDVIYSTYGSKGLPPDVEFALDHMTTEEPAMIASCMDELLYQYTSSDAVWNYIDELYKYETGEPLDPKEFFSDHNYHESVIDPLTLQCLRTPTYLLLSNIRTYISSQQMMYACGNLGANPQNDEFTSNIVPFSFESKIDHYSKLQLIEELVRIPSDWCTVQMDWDKYIQSTMSRYNSGCSESFESLHNTCRQLFLNKWVNHDYAYDNIVLSKNWYDEIFISCKNKMGITTYYINLAWYHLTSPSLINQSLFIK